MSSLTQFLTTYPELVAAAVLLLVLLAVALRPKANSSSSQFLLPAFLTEPAVYLMRFAPGKYLVWLQQRLVFAGWRNNLYFGSLCAAKVYPCLLTVFLPLFVHPGYALLALFFLFFSPDCLLAVMAKKRQQSLAESLPQVIDLMVLCVDAGLGLDATIQKVASERTALSSAINDELLTLSRDVLLGMNREKAYQELYNRTGVEELRSLSASLNQSAQLGISVSKVLRNQAEFLRNKLGQKAEEKAARLPVLMAFPLWFCIMPTLMVLVLAPSLIIFFEQVRPMTGLGMGP
ncbi:MAG: tight adherence protein [Cyanobacteriota bacterium erpe_2018_sw_21hr_WHONDRS-SW48-000092_B_bin.40]|jgi:tight adherence protein C|nr:tight adherence protein [Cyanobacteriota bacterium erpe_2018_sw_21hr_WHONDRS-SW48-000092_B_bin.40]